MPPDTRTTAVVACLGRVCRGLVHPVMLTFFLASALSFLSGDILSAVYLLVVGLVLGLDRGRCGAVKPAAAEPAGTGPGAAEPGAAAPAGAAPAAAAQPGVAGGPRALAVFSGESAEQRRDAMRQVRVPALIAAIAYAALVGWFGRHSWGATVLAFIPAVAGVIVAWLVSAESRAELRPLRWGGVAAWAAVWGGAAVWEITSLFLQPSITTGSYAHPTLSYLVDQPLASWGGRSVIVFGWLALGWYLARR